MEALTDLERAALELLLAGPHPILATLRQQYAQAWLVRRDLRVDGFHCHFEVAANAPVLAEGSVAQDFELGDVQADLDGLSNGAGFLLFVRGGRLSTLQGFSYLEPWPSEVQRFTLSYAELGRTRELAKLGK